MMHRRSAKTSAWLLVVMATALLCANGCVRRRLTINSTPPGALVYIGNEQIGVTPVSVNFLYYGVREIRLVKDGFETEVVEHDVPAPWYEYPPFDFFSENLWPKEIRDERVFDIALRPQRIIPNEEIYGRAQDLRGRARQGIIAPSPPLAAPPTAWPQGSWPQGQPAAPLMPPQAMHRLPPTDW